MKYKFYQYVNASNAIKKMMGMDFDFKDSYNLYRLAKQFDSVVQFGAERERELLEKYNGTITNDGYINFTHGEGDESKRAGDENKAAFQKALAELNDTLIDEDITPVCLSIETMTGKPISPNDIMAIDGFVLFK